MSAFAGLVTTDRHRLHAAIGAWNTAQRGAPAAQDWHFDNAHFRCWSQDAALRADGWLALVDHPRQQAAPFAEAWPPEQARAPWAPPPPGSASTEFALAAWHAARGELHFCRDAIGGYPIFYHLMADGIAFATDLPLLLHLPFVPRELNARTIAATRARDDSMRPSDSFYRDVRILPAGHAATYCDGAMEVRRWWFPNTAAPVPSDPADTLRREIIRSVNERMDGGQRVAVHLSGGLDSSAIACIAARRLRQEGKRLIALSSVLPAGWHGPETDERAHIAAVAAQEPNIDVHWLSPQLSLSPLAALETLFETLGDPGYSNVSHIDDVLGRTGRELGVDVVLSGFGGDFFASWRGGGVIAALLGAGEWSRAGRELTALRRSGAGGWLQLVKRHILAPLLRGPRGDRVPTLAQLSYASPGAQMAFMAQPGHLERALNASVKLFDRAYGQSLRFPLLDRRIVELMIGMPARELQREGVQRSLFRRAMKGIVPEQILAREDKGAAFDPQLAARVIAARDELAAWADRPGNAAYWSADDRAAFLRELATVERSGRAGWSAGMFQDVLLAGALARFAEWNAARTRDRA